MINLSLHIFELLVQTQLQTLAPETATKEKSDRMNEVRSLHRTEEQISLQLELERYNIAAYRFIGCQHILYNNLDSISTCVLIGQQVCFHSAMKHENDVSDMIACLQVVRTYSFMVEIKL